MIVYQATQAGAADLDASDAAHGLLEFDAHVGWGNLSQDVVPVIYSIHVTLAAAAAGRIQAQFTDGTYVDVLADNGAAGVATSYHVDWERGFRVWRDGTGNPWDLHLLTTKGGAGNVHASVHWRPERG